MEAELEAAQDWFFEQLARRLAEVFEAMAGARPEIRIDGAASLAAAERLTGPEPASGPAAGALRWRQALHGAPGAVWIHASDQDWIAASNQILRAAGIEDADQESLRSTWTETVGQALSAIAQDCSGRLAREVTCAAGEESADPGPARWTRIRIRFPGVPTPVAEIAGAIEDRLLEALRQPALNSAAAASALQAPESPASGSAAPGSQSSVTAPDAGPSVLTSKTFDLLLDVELPVSVSFGRAQVPLKDVIKLKIGAIVELNRSLSEPVEVMVNNCVIARGEVVVVEGNFGVKIREVTSRQDRLRTLN
jgi:flagellar motor switch protein FliN